MSSSAPVPLNRSKSNFLWIGTALAALVLIVGVYVFVVPSSAVPKVYHVGILNALDYFASITDGFKQGMTTLGYVEGTNIIYDVQKGPAPVGNKNILEKFVADKVDLILSFPTEATQEAKEVTANTGIPVVGAGIGIEGTNLVESVQHPGGNVTGVRFPLPEIALKRLALLHTIAPRATRILVPYLKDYPTVAAALPGVKALAISLKVTLIEEPVSSPDDLASYLKAREANPNIGIDAILMLPEPISITPAFYDQLYVFADRHKIPIASATILDTDHGPIIGLLPQAFEAGKLAALLADKIFKGIAPATIPVVTEDVFLDINYRVIQKLGLTVDEGLLSTANRVFH